MIYFLIALFIMIFYAYVDRFLHKNISEKKSVLYHFVLNLLSGISFIFLLVSEFETTFFIFPGVILILFSLYVLYKSKKDLGKNFYLTEKFIDKGIYGKVRHPMYFGLIVLFLGFSLFSYSSLILAYTIVMIIMLYFLMLDEEKMLIKKYGKKYEQYKKKVPALILRLA